MDVNYINPFLNSIRSVFDTMIQIPLTIGKPSLKKDAVPRYDISSIIGLSGEVSGCVVLNLSEALAMQLASGLIGEEVTEIDESCTDAIGEIANMIAGAAKKDLPGENNSISVPSIIIGRHKIRYPRGLPIISIPCDTSAGRLAVEVALKHSRVAATV
ncbi:MAG: chemotaxis protein CheX [Sedimentisphaerales bacterium]|nr:chemotaxis protein CheX [Sedimentisphaerales bacterium]